MDRRRADRALMSELGFRIGYKTVAQTNLLEHAPLEPSFAEKAPVIEKSARAA